MSDDESSESSAGTDDIFSDRVTLGKLTDFETVIWRFPHTDQCPLKSCKLSCSSRGVALGHFHMQHADTTMICQICSELISVENPLTLFRHYQDYHPKNSPPKLKPTERNGTIRKNAGKSQQPKAKEGYSKGEENEGQDDEIDQYQKEQNEEDDTIILSGCGQITCWNFPKRLAKCPINVCHATVKNRDEAIRHYRATHAQLSILCPICNVPIVARAPNKFKRHYDRKHPNMEIPFNFMGRINRSEKSTKKVRLSSLPESDSEIEFESNDESNNECDLIQLKYGKWRFPQQTGCPVISCGKQFGKRLDAMLHYEKVHAMNAIYCRLCNKPVRTDVHKDEFIRHFQKKHPNQEIPYGLGRTSANQVELQLPQQHDESDSNVSEVEASSVDDLIKLVAFGIVTYWKFPANLKKCPVWRCNQTFKSKSDGIIHYKTHAKGSYLCRLCNRPIRCQRPSDLKKHYGRIHPTAKFPYDNHTNRSDTGVQKQQMHEDNGDDNIITLSGCGLNMEWKFPNDIMNSSGTHQCPVKNCFKKFDERSDAIVHFRQRHARRSTLCPICNIPVYMRSFCDIKHHYDRRHPTDDLPSYFINSKRNQMNVEKPNMDKSQTKRIENESSRQPAERNHKKQRLSCPLKHCNYGTMQMAELCTHWTRKHGDLVFPEYRENNRFTYTVDTPNTSVDGKVKEEKKVKLSKGNNVAKKSSPSKPLSPISVSSVSESSDEDSLLHQKSRIGKRKRSGEWFTLTSDDDDDDDDENNIVPVQNNIKRKKSGVESPKLSYSESDGKWCSSSSSSSQDDQATDEDDDDDMPSQRNTREKRITYFADEESSSD